MPRDISGKKVSRHCLKTKDMPIYLLSEPVSRRFTHLPGVPLKTSKRLIDHRPKGFYSIIKCHFDFNRKYSNLDSEIKFTQIRYEFAEIHQFQN